MRQNSNLKTPITRPHGTKHTRTQGKVKLHFLWSWFEQLTVKVHYSTTSKMFRIVLMKIRNKSLLKQEDVSHPPLFETHGEPLTVLKHITLLAHMYVLI